MTEFEEILLKAFQKRNITNTVLWVSFRIKDNASYQHRYNNFHKALNNHIIDSWDDNTSFIIFSSASSIVKIKDDLKVTLNVRTDSFIIRTMNVKRAYIFGNVKNNIFTLVPYLKRA